MNYEIVPAFSIPIGITRIDLKFCDPLKKLKGLYQGAEENGKGELDYRVLDQLPEIKKEILRVFTFYINDQILGISGQKYVMTTSWITENKTGAAMHRHCHKNAYYSTVLYFSQVVPEHAPLMIENPINKGTIYIQPNSATIFNIEDYVSPIREGLMLIFPSYLNHYHAPFRPTAIPRKSLACNFMPIGKYGEFDSTIDSEKLYG